MTFAHHAEGGIAKLDSDDEVTIARKVARKKPSVPTDIAVQILCEEYDPLIRRLIAKQRFYNELHAGDPDDPEKAMRFKAIDTLLGHVQTKKDADIRKLERRKAKVRIEADPSGRVSVRVGNGGEAVSTPEGDGEDWTY